MLRRINLFVAVSFGVAGLALAAPAGALPGGSQANDVYTDPGSALWGNAHLSTPSTPLTLTNANGATAGLGGLVLDVAPNGKVTGGTGLWVPPGASIGELATVTSGSIKNGKATADGTAGGTRLKLTLVMNGLNRASVNSTSQTIGTGTITATVW